MVWRLLVGAYGLKDAPLLWNLRLLDVLHNQLGLLRCQFDGCLFYMAVGGQLLLIISVHVDDTLVAGRPGKPDWLAAELEKRFGPL